MLGMEAEKELRVAPKEDCVEKKFLLDLDAAVAGFLACVSRADLGVPEPLEFSGELLAVVVGDDPRDLAEPREVAEEVRGLLEQLVSGDRRGPGQGELLREHAVGDLAVLLPDAPVFPLAGLARQRLLLGPGRLRELLRRGDVHDVVHEPLVLFADELFCVSRCYGAALG